MMTETVRRAIAEREYFELFAEFPAETLDEALEWHKHDSEEWAACGRAMAQAESDYFERYEPARLEDERELEMYGPFDPWGEA